MGNTVAIKLPTRQKDIDYIDGVLNSLKDEFGEDNCWPCPKDTKGFYC